MKKSEIKKEVSYKLSQIGNRYWATANSGNNTGYYPHFWCEKKVIKEITQFIFCKMEQAYKEGFQGCKDKYGIME